MLCASPYMAAGLKPYPCGQCLPCRFNRRRIWTHRLMLEAALHGDNAFVTLTYSDANLPTIRPPAAFSESGTVPTLVPKHTQDFLKRFRKAASPLRLRFYLVGEYGEQTQRPHYHMAAFGYPTCSWGRSRYSRSRTSCCANCDLVLQAWGHGLVDLGSLETNSAQYIAGYVTKKMTSRDDPRLAGRHPEFARMSNRPGIGADYMDEVASTLMQFDLDTSQPDVPSALRHGSRILPLGRYLRRRLRTRIGKEPNAPASTLQEADAPLLEMRSAAYQTDSPLANFKKALLDENEGARSSLEKKQLIFKKRSAL